MTGTSFLSNSINSGARTFTEKTKPNPKPLTFSPAAQERIRKINSLTHGAVGLSAATVGQVGKVAQGIGATLSRRGEGKSRGPGSAPGNTSGNASRGSYRPGVLNKSMIAFSTIADGIEQGARQLLDSGSTAASSIVEHRYGQDAGRVAAQLASGVKNVGLVYIDATGVSRKAVLKSVAKGMVVGRTPGGGHVVVGDGDGGQVPPEMMPPPQKQGAGMANQALPGSGQSGPIKPGEGHIGFGNAAPPAQGSGIGEPLGSQTLPGHDSYPYEKR